MVTDESSVNNDRSVPMTDLQGIRDLLFEVLCSGQLDRDLTLRIQKALDGTFDLAIAPDRR